jgi:hypothetical protein
VRADNRAGALGFGGNQQPPAPKRDFNKTLSLARPQKIADAIVDEEDRPDNAEAAQVEELMLVGTSMCGARPKAVVEDTDGLRIAKFSGEGRFGATASAAISSSARRATPLEEAKSNFRAAWEKAKREHRPC